MAKGTLQKINFTGSPDAPAVPLSPIEIQELIPGLDEASSTREAISLIEEAISDLPVEHLVIWDPIEMEVVYAAKGNENSVGFPSDQSGKYAGCVVTHNHPREDKDVMGGTFSTPDCDALLQGFQEIRAASGSLPDRGTYVIDSSDANHSDVREFVAELHELAPRIDGQLAGIVARYREKLEERLRASGKKILGGKPTKEEHAACFNEQLWAIDKMLSTLCYKHNLRYRFEGSEEEPSVKPSLRKRMRRWLAQYKAATSKFSSREDLDKIAKTSSRYIMSRVASNENASSETLAYLLSWGCETEVARNKGADEEILRAILDKGSCDSTLAGREDLPADMAEEIFERHLDEGFYETWDVYYALAGNISTPKRVLNKLKKSSELEGSKIVELAKETLSRKKESMSAEEWRKAK